MTSDPYAARLTVARLFLEMSKLVAERGGPADRLHRLGCLAQALDDRVDELAAIGGHRPDERRRLESAPCTVRFTTDTGVPPDIRMMSVARILAAAAEHEREIRGQAAAEQEREIRGPAGAEHEREIRGQAGAQHEREIRGQGGAQHEREIRGQAGAVSGRRAEPARANDDRLSEELAKLDELVAAAGRAGLGNGDLKNGPGTATVDEVARTRRALRGRYHAELAGRLEAYRQKAVDESPGERADLEPFYRAAREALNPRGFDLAAASDAVLAYQRAVNGEIP